MAVKAGHEEYLELAEIYALSALDGADRLRLEAHLASGCETCRDAIFDSEKILADLALAAPLAAPPDSVRERLFDRVRRDSPFRNFWKETSSRPSRVLMALAAAATLAAVGLGLHARTLERRAETDRVSREALKRDLGSLTETLEAFTAPATRAMSLSGQGDAQGAAAKAFLDPENRRLFLYVYNLPPPPPGRTYQLWLIVGGAPVSMGTFGVEPDGRGRLDTASIPRFEGEVTVAVTVEPSGGVSQPTGPMVLVGS
jgi:anti-sigma-K factor RskA